MKTLRILFTIICALSLALLPLVGILWVNWIAVPILTAGISFLLMIKFKTEQERQENIEAQQPAGDYFSPASTQTDVQPEEENGKTDETDKKE